MTEDFELNGRAVHVWTESRGSRWTWCYTIDGQGLRQCQDNPLPSEKLALEEGVQEARRAAGAASGDKGNG